MNCKRFGRKRLWPNWWAVSVFAWRDRGKPRTSSEYSVFQSRFQPSIIRIQSVTPRLTCSILKVLVMTLIRRKVYRLLRSTNKFIELIMGERWGQQQVSPLLIHLSGSGTFNCHTMPHRVHKLHTQCLWCAPSPGLQMPGREADYPPPSNIEIKRMGSHTSTPSCFFVEWY
jgi:hypothetical protein